MFDRMFTSGLENQEIEICFTPENTGIAISWFVELLFVLFYVGFVIYQRTCQGEHNFEYSISQNIKCN